MRVVYASGIKEALYPSTLLQRGRRETQERRRGRYRGVDEKRLCTPLLFYREAAGRYKRDVGGDAGEGTRGVNISEELPYIYLVGGDRELAGIPVRTR